MVRFHVLASGSKANAAILQTDTTCILIDDGLSLKALTARMKQLGLDPKQIDAVLVTHEHGDHVDGLESLLKWRGKKMFRPLPVYVPSGSVRMLEWKDPWCAEAILPFEAGKTFRIQDVIVSPFTVPHDAVDPVAYCLEAQGLRFGLATDLGHIPPAVATHFEQIHCLLIESNYDADMLKIGPYPFSVKQRVMSRNGHLSNADTCDYLRTRACRELDTLILAHMSEQNNLSDLVRHGAADALAQRGMKLYAMHLASQHEPQTVFKY